LRHWDAGDAAICAAENGERFGLGVCRPLSRLDGEDVRNTQEMGILCRGQSRNRDRASGKESSPGEKTNTHLGTECLAALETDNSTPYSLNLHNGEVAHTLILGMTGSGKTTTLTVIRSAAEKRGYQVEGFAPTSRAVRLEADSRKT
jgi:AAA domain-containing protein